MSEMFIYREIQGITSQEASLSYGFLKNGTPKMPWIPWTAWFLMDGKYVFKMRNMVVLPRITDRVLREEEEEEDMAVGAVVVMAAVVVVLGGRILLVVAEDRILDHIHQRKGLAPAHLVAKEEVQTLHGENASQGLLNQSVVSQPQSPQKDKDPGLVHQNKKVDLLRIQHHHLPGIEASPHHKKLIMSNRVV